MNKLQTECIEHEWEFEPGDWCPVCHGIEIAEQRIIKLLEDKLQNIIYANQSGPTNDFEVDCEQVSSDLIALIKEGKE